MRQIIQSLKNGTVKLVDIPAPRIKPGHVLIRTRASLISAGTERMLIEFGRSGLIDKARQQPDKVRQLFDKIRTDGVAPAIGAVRDKMEQPLPLGYCNAGEVVDVGSEVEGFSPGDRVASNGNHAELVCVPKNLCARIPDGVSDEEASFAVLGAIALQGVRLSEPTLGESFAVVGLGLLGLLTVQILRANGCRVIGADYDPMRLGLAREFGASAVDLSQGEDPVEAVEAFSNGRGVDGVIITAAADNSEPLRQAALMCRKKGRVTLVGVTGMELDRGIFFKKELTFKVSCSYGPGRYDPAYEEKGHDYPLGYVRWTEQRNFEAILQLFADGRMNAKQLVSHKFPLEEATRAYDLIVGNKDPYLGVMLTYGHASAESTVRLKQVTAERSVPARSAAHETATVSFIGAGNYAGRILIPAFKKAGVKLKSIATSGGVNGVHFGKKYGFEEATTDTCKLLADAESQAVVVATRHDSHAHFVGQALAAGKHVFVEKPLCLTHDELDAIFGEYRKGVAAGRRQILMVGFNRRFAPHIRKMKYLLDKVAEPKAFIMTINAGAIPADHWTQDEKIGGGRIIGEACHFIDLLRHLAGSQIKDAHSFYLGGETLKDKVTIAIHFNDGSLGTIHYLANGHRSFPKERLEVFCSGRVLQLDNYRRMQGYGWPGFKKMNLWRQDKGQDACAAAFIDAVRTSAPSPIPMAEVEEVARVTIELCEVK
ncbi:MAG: zinc-binding dehydrogenase [Pseudomonadota bacterium]